MMPPTGRMIQVLQDQTPLGTNHAVVFLFEEVFVDSSFFSSRLRCLNSLEA